MTETFHPFSEELLEMSQFASALAHPARLAVVTQLRDGQEASCGQLVEALPLAQATVSQHLKVLVEAGLLHSRREGHKIMYQLDCDRVRRFCHAFQCNLGTVPGSEDMSS